MPSSITHLVANLRASDMHKPFLAVSQSLLQKPSSITGLWLAHSDEPLVLQWLVDACRPSWQEHHQIIKRIELTAAKSWQEVINELSTLSLFAESTAIIITGKQKLDDATANELARFADDAKAGNSQHHLLWLLPKQDKKAQATKAFKLFDNQGLIIDGNIANERVRRELLTDKAKQLNLTLTADAWQVLMSHTEHDLLNAYQALWRLSYTHNDGNTIDVPTLMTLLVDGGSFSVFDLSDAIINHNATAAIKIIHHLKNTDTAASIVLWAILRDIHAIAGIKNAQDPTTLGIWRNKVAAYQALSRRIQPQTLAELLAIGYEIDKAIKGLSDENPWRLLERAALLMCGVAVL
ncbi:DNA polymerase III subunit delta [Moraxella marmotae]|uniref:DNA polymerase III subunit delta n=1 Tax=Moraxella marmotae TaxID=3344520 RepID=UPI0035F2CC28